ncbi:hypothetical protein MXL46_04395 [Heyndrickxia sporothermodurans]|uniref:Uncharacterized protein n=1 Tax=Heyndrickxia sporothermodurans TaxID=46224 RepID=A0A150LID2_9BACI|nr:hypothetical protein [Heyndrickxia sporothermodurans]KYD11502.1 hypothetical protein B4102_0173 [Heyndrickxia sporothermodurans]MBL5768582.1 hypothetical protein [Heyndrickxia sporothermodurans]MBL5772309.1 hypothetical protein [Heyndrickxia sporothermodurans]MBL5779601.1 hypothetical protein [Heyndrickxia sporothermodurans]MBL5783266.1 hypothetical protein [Heyndrickxia sporothermodurans]
MPSRWTIYQCIVVLFLVILLFIVEMFKSYFSVSLSLNGTSTIIPLLLTFLFIIIVVGCSSLLMIFQTKKSTLFLTHRIWMKMYILTPLLLILSITFFITAALASINFQEFMQEQRWTLYVFICYFIFMMNLFVLSVIHKIKGESISKEAKIKASYLWTSLILFIIIFMLP